MELTIDNFLLGLSEADKLLLAQKILLNLPLERKAKLLENAIADLGLVGAMNGYNRFVHDAQGFANVALPNQDIAGAAIPNLYTQIQSNNADLASVIEAVVMARRQN